MENFLTYLFFFSLCLFLLFLLTKFLNKAWLTPFLIQSALRSQGIKGPSYRFLHGNTKEIMSMFRTRRTTTKARTEVCHDVFPMACPHIYEWNKLYGDMFLMFTPKAELVVAGPELVKEVLGDNDGGYPKKESDTYLSKLLGDGIITTRGEKWSTVRKIANHAFHSESLKGMFGAMVQSVEMMLERWREHEGKEIEVCREFKILTSEIISRTAFGSSYLEGEHIFSMLARLATLTIKNKYEVKIPGIGRFMKSRDEIEADNIEQAIRDSISNMIKKEEAAIEAQPESKDSNFLRVLVKSNQDAEKGKKLSVDDMVDECKSFYVAGQETTTNALAWIAMLLGLHGDWQDKAREEVLDLIGHENPTPDGISRLKIMNLIINEALRLYTPVVSISRAAAKGARLGQLVLPRKLQVLVLPLAINHDPRIWGQDAHLFKPERFADGFAKATSNNANVFIPFGLGPRNCVGSSFANAELKIALSMILQRYRLKLSPNYVHSPTLRLTLTPEHGVQVKLEAL